MVLRGIYLSTREENINYYTNLNRYYPEEYHKIMELLPDSISELTDPALMKLYQSDKKQLDVTSRLELKAERLYIDDKELDEYFSSAENMKELNTIYGIYYHYLVNSCFLEEGQLLNNISKIQHVPVTIINGRHDLICPPLYAYILHKKLPSSNLIIAEKAGHVMSEKPIERELLKAMERLEELMDQKNIMND